MKGVYKITCKANGKVYIGESEDVFRRWEQHMHFSNPVTELQRDLVKYGITRFSFVFLKSCEDAQERKKLEHDYIVLYKAFLETKGYNSKMYFVGRVIGEFDPVNITKIRKAKGISIKELAEKINVSETHINVVEKGQGKPSKIAMYRIAHALGCSVADFHKKGGVA